MLRTYVAALIVVLCPWVLLLERSAVSDISLPSCGCFSCPSDRCNAACEWCR